MENLQLYLQPTYFKVKMLIKNPLTKYNAISLKQVVTWLKQDLFLLSGIIVSVGIVLRLRQYFANLSLWRDEASLALNIIERSFGGLTQPLDDNQGAPILFLWLEKGMVTLFGSSEYILRFLPFACGIISIFAFWFIASRFLSKRGIFIALMLFAFSDPLIEFSSELKQYSCDVFISILVLIMLFYLKTYRNLGYISTIGCGLLGAIIIWASHPAIFLLAAVGVATIYDSYSKGDYRRIPFLTIIGAMWIISFLTFYTISLNSLTNNQYLLDSWRDGFPPSNPILIPGWIVSSFLYVFKEPGGLSTFGLGAFVYMIGFISLYRRDRVILIGLVFPILFTMFASLLWKYPFLNRLILFITPLLFLLIAEGLDQALTLLSRSQFSLAAPLLVLILFFDPLIGAGTYLVTPKLKEEIRPVIEHVHNNWQKGDIIYVYYGAVQPFKYYKRQFGFQESDFLVGIESRQQWINYLPDLNRLRNYKRVWLIFSHVYSGNGVNEELLMINWLDRNGSVQKDWFPRAGASSYLYKFDQ